VHDNYLVVFVVEQYLVEIKEVVLAVVSLFGLLCVNNIILKTKDT